MYEMLSSKVCISCRALCTVRAFIVVYLYAIRDVNK